MSGPEVLQRLAIPVPAVGINSTRAMGRLLHGMSRDLAVATRAALEGGNADALIDQIDRAEPWPPMASGVHVAAEVLGHIADRRSAVIPHRLPADDC